MKKHGFKPGVQEAVTPPNDIGSFCVIIDGEVVTTVEAKHSGQRRVHEKNGKQHRLNPVIVNTEEDTNTDEAQDRCEWGPGPTCAYNSIVTTLYCTHKQLWPDSISAHPSCLLNI